MLVGCIATNAEARYPRYPDLVYEFKCLDAHGYLCQAHLDFLKQWKAARRKTNLANLYVPVGRLLKVKVRGAKED